MMTHARQQFVGQKLQTASQALGLARFQLRTGQIQELQATLDQIHAEIQGLRRQVLSPGPRAARADKARADELLAGYLD